MRASTGSLIVPGQHSLSGSRFRPGHPEGYALAFANLYTDFAMAIINKKLAPMVLGHKAPTGGGFAAGFFLGLRF